MVLTRSLDRRRAPSVLPLVLIIGVCVLLVVGYWISVQWSRIKPSGPDLAPAPSANLATPAPAPSTPAPVNPGVAERTGADAPPAVPEPLPINELVVEPLKKTWVKVRRNTPDSEPAFEGDIYPGLPPLKVTGTRLFVEVRDESAVRIRKNGTPIAYQAPGITIP
jgi:hypothetical protein